MEHIPDVSGRVLVPGDVQRVSDGARLSLRRLRSGPVRRGILRLFGIPGHYTVHLDPLGAAVWELADGRRTVGDIHAELAKRFPLERDLAPRLGKFVSILVSKGFARLS